MGYQVPRNIANISFADTPFDGAEVKCSLDIDIDSYLLYQRIASSQGIDGVDDIVTRFGNDALIAWNLEDKNGEPIPPTGESFRRQPVPFVAAVLQAYIEAVGQPSAPLVVPSPNGVTSVELPTATGTQ